MSSAAEQSLDPFLPLEQLREARSIIQAEADALADLAQRLDGEFPRACETLFRCRGSVIVTGMGKAGLIGQKIAATLSSTGTRAFCLHPAEAVHGDLGCLHADDALLALSNSGETEEICRVLPTVQEMQIPIVAITASANSTLGSQADVTIRIGKLREAGLHGLAPSSTDDGHVGNRRCTGARPGTHEWFDASEVCNLPPSREFGGAIKNGRQHHAAW